MTVQVMIVILGEVGGQILGHAGETSIALMKAFRSRRLMDGRHLHLRALGDVRIGRENHRAIPDYALVAHG